MISAIRFASREKNDSKSKQSDEHETGNKIDMTEWLKSIESHGEQAIDGLE